MTDLGHLSLDNDLLSPVTKKAAESSECLSPDARGVKLEESLVWYLVKRLSEVKQDNVRLTVLINLCSQVIDHQDHLGLT